MEAFPPSRTPDPSQLPAAPWPAWKLLMLLTAYSLALGGGLLWILRKVICL
jgi:hypothetical protein